MKCYCPLFCIQKEADIQYVIHFVAARAGAFLVHTMKQVEDQRLPSLAPAVHVGKWVASRPDHFTSSIRVPGTHGRRDWVGLNSQSGCFGVEKNLSSPVGNRKVILRLWMG